MQKSVWKAKKVKEQNLKLHLINADNNNLPLIRSSFTYIVP